MSMKEELESRGAIVLSGNYVGTNIINVERDAFLTIIEKNITKIVFHTDLTDLEVQGQKIDRECYFLVVYGILVSCVIDGE